MRLVRMNSWLLLKSQKGRKNDKEKARIRMTNREQYELICEKAEKYDRLVGVLDKIRAEIEAEPYVSKMEVLDIIDKYKAESEREDGNK